MKVTIVFDKEAINDSFHCGWGISYLIGDVLFDTAEKPEFLIHNIKALGRSIDVIRHVVISHNNWDHRGGLWELLKLNPSIKVYACSDFLDEFEQELSRYQCVRIEANRHISEDIFSSGCLKAKYRHESLEEQALAVKTQRGISIVTGCAHPGILSIIDRVRSQLSDAPLYSVFGGFHLMETDIRVVRFIASEMKRLGVKKVGPAHCCGFEAANIFRHEFGEDYLEIKAGMVFDV